LPPRRRLSWRDIGMITLGVLGTLTVGGIVWGIIWVVNWIIRWFNG